jgi:membrane fusion protein, copper/silver efflux system
MPTNNEDRSILPKHPGSPTSRDDEGGLRAPPELTGWRKAWWWFDFVVLVNLARLRFIAILLVIGVIIVKWDTLTAYYEKWTRPATTQAAVASDVEYFCPMHPTVIRDRPGEKCPICFMPLSKRKKGAQQADALPAGVVSRVQLSPYRVVLAGVQTWPVDFQPLTKEISAVGFVEFNERGQRTVAARVAGRIDKLYANTTGQMVRAGDDLAEIYSPELVVSVQNLLDAKRRGGGDVRLDPDWERLRRWGIDDAQLEEIVAAGKAETDLKIRSQINGHVITKYVREGQYVERGTPLFELADLSTVWIQAQLYEDDLALLPQLNEDGSVGSDSPEGIAVTTVTRAFPNEVFHGKLAFIYPHVDQDTRTVTVRFELENPDHKLRPGSTAMITLKVSPKDVPLFANLPGDEDVQRNLVNGRLLAVPESAIIDTGRQRIVYRETTPGVFEGVEVTVGPRMVGPDSVLFYPVLGGLKKGDRVVTSGSFLVDAETRLNPAAGSIYFGGSGSSQARAATTTVRPSTPENPVDKIEAALAALSPDDRVLAEAQRFCPVLPKNRLGVMGPPIKLTIEGQTVFICCEGCRQTALEEPQETLDKVQKLKQADAAAR